MAQGIFSSLQFLGCIRLMKVIFFSPNMKNLSACLHLSKPFRQKSLFWCAGCISVSEGRCRRLLKNPCWGTMSLSIFQHVAKEKKTSLIFEEPSGHVYLQVVTEETWVCLRNWAYATHQSPSYHGSPLNASLRLRPIFIFLIKARVHQCFVIFSSVFQ